MKKIMVVDNDRIILRFMTKLLEKEGYQVVTAADGLNALDILKTYTPDVIFVDLVMPNIDGEALCRLIRDMPKLKDVYLIILSAITVEERTDISQFGANVIIAKGPFNETAQHVLYVLNQPDLASSRCLSGEVFGIKSVYPRGITKELMSIKKHFEIILERMSEGILEINSEGRIVYVNPAALLLINKLEKELLGSSFVDLFSGDDRRRVGSLMKIKSNKPKTITEDAPVRLNGHQVTLNILSLYEDESKFIVILSDVSERKLAEEALRKAHSELEKRVEERTAELTTANEQLNREIDERKQAEEALRESEETIRALFNATTDSAFLMDLEGTVIAMNIGGVKRIGRSLDEIIGRCIYDFIQADVAESKKAKIEEVFSSGKPICFTDQRAGMHLYHSIYPIFDKQGKVEKVAVFARDITEQKLVEKELLEEEEKYRFLVESTEDHIYLVDKNLRYLFVNQKYLSRFALPMNKILGSKYEEFHSNEETKDFAEKVNKVFKSGESLSYEYRSERDSRYFIRTLNPVKEKDGRTMSVTVISKEITERIQAEESLKLSNEKLLKESNQRKVLSKRLIDLLEKDRKEIAMELHDHIGQILTALKMNLEMIGSRLKHSDHELASQIKDAEQKAIDALTDINHISHGLKPGMLDTLGLKPSLGDLFDGIQEQTDIKINFFSRNVPKRFAHEKELAVYRIAQEALTNIIKHAKAKNVFVNLSKMGDVLFLSVEDDGVGFEPGQVMGSISKKKHLGLVIMKERAVQFGGEFSIESRKPGGTHLSVEIAI